MPNISKNEYIQRVRNFVEAHKSSYTDLEYNYLISSARWALDKPFLMDDIIRQVFEEVGSLPKELNMYEGFLELLEENFDINTDIIEVGGGIVPSLSKKIALRQKSGTITVYDPRLMTDFNHPSNLVLKKENFKNDTPIGKAKLIIGFMPCEATNILIQSACKNKVDFMLALCEGGSRPGYEWLEYDDEWIAHMKHNAIDGMEGTNMGTLEVASLEQYGNPYPVIYNKRKKV